MNITQSILSEARYVLLLLHPHTWEFFAAESKQYAYIKDYKIDFLDNVEPLFSKVKKDGTMSEVNLFVNLTNTKIELVKE